MAIVGLISCVSRKKPYATEAQFLYDSALFEKSRRYVQEKCDRWYILSAKYGLLAPHQAIEPYEETLKEKPRDIRKKWAMGVWDKLGDLLSSGDHVIILAGASYRDFLLPFMLQKKCTVEVPLEGKSIGRQLQWLSDHLSERTRENDLEQLYSYFRILEIGLGGKRLISECTGQQNWPQSGVYLFFESGELRKAHRIPRVVRVGTHGVSRGSKATLWNRLRTHRGTSDGLGNHRSSVFRFHIGSALSKRDPHLYINSWGKPETTAEIRYKEEDLERAVSNYINSMSILWISVEDESGPASDRAYLERNMIGLLAGRQGPIDIPSENWLGLYSPHDRIKRSGLWNLDFIDYSYSNTFLDILKEYIWVTINKRPKPLRSIAPEDWYFKERQKIPDNQLALFGDIQDD
jgi:hypothetical protein